MLRGVPVNSFTQSNKPRVPQSHGTTSIHTLHAALTPALREGIKPGGAPPAYRVDVGQRALTGELHSVHLHGRACLSDLALVAQGSHIEHEGLSGANELIVHLGQEKAAKQNRQVAQFSFLPLTGVSQCAGHSGGTLAM